MCDVWVCLHAGVCGCVLCMLCTVNIVYMFIYIGGDMAENEKNGRIHPIKGNIVEGGITHTCNRSPPVSTYMPVLGLM